MRTLSEIIENAIETLNDRIEEGLLDETYPEDELHEIADGAVPVYTAEVFEVAATSPDARHVDDEGLIEGVTDAEKVIQTAIYENVSNALHGRLYEAQNEREDA